MLCSMVGYIASNISKCKPRRKLGNCFLLRCCCLAVQHAGTVFSLKLLGAVYVWYLDVCCLFFFVSVGVIFFRLKPPNTNRFHGNNCRNIQGISVFILFKGSGSGILFQNAYPLMVFTYFYLIMWQKMK